MARPEEAERRFREGVNCAQAILATYGPALGLDEGLALRLGSGLGGGFGHTGRICGAVAGACLVLGLKYGSSDTQADRKSPIDEVKKFLDLFNKDLGTVDCLPLLGQDIRSPEGLAKARNNDLFREKCPPYVHKAAEILEGLL